MKGEEEFLDFMENLCKTRPEFLEMTPQEVIEGLVKEQVILLNFSFSLNLQV
jgi:hypothetical protein